MKLRNVGCMFSRSLLRVVHKFGLATIAASFGLLLAVSAQAQLRITEVAAWGSGDSPIASDWFELTNFGVSSVNIAGWRMDDNSNMFASSVALTGITSIAAGESVIFTETATAAAFKNLWFGVSPPAGLQVGNYAGGGVGLGTGGDAVNIYSPGGTLEANVTFGASPGLAPFATFDNSQGLNNTAISLLSIVGVNGAFAAVGDPNNEIGSPGRVPEPTGVLLLVCGAAMSLFSRRRT
jgi:hypothetical protein